MRLGLLRQLIKDYDATVYLRKNLPGVGDHKRALTIKNFVNRFVFYADDYHLSAEDELSLAKILAPMKEDYLPLVTHFKSQFSGSADFFELFTFLQSKHIQDDLLKQLLEIKPIYYTKILSLTKNLERHFLVSNESIQKLFKLITNKVPGSVEERFNIETQQDEQDSWTIFKSTKDSFQVFTRKEPEKEELSGGRGSVLPATLSKTDTKTGYLIKTLKGKENEHVKDEASREAKYAQFLGRHARFFKHDEKWHVISEWQTGETLYHISEDKDKLTSIPIKMRIKSILPLLKEIVQLHGQYRVHGDIKGLNCVFDIQNLQMKLIDFGSTRKVKPKKYPLAITNIFLDSSQRQGLSVLNCQVNYSFCDDMYALGILLASAFPDIFNVLKSDYKTTVELQKSLSSLSAAEKSIYFLVTSMTMENRNARCTSKIALDYCQYLFEHFENLDQRLLMELLNRTLNKSSLSFEDVINDHYVHLSILSM